MTLDVEFSTECIPITLIDSGIGSHIHNTDLDPNLHAAGAHSQAISTSRDRLWVTAAKVGQLLDVQGITKVLTREAIMASLGTWKNGNIVDDHNGIREGFQIYGDKFEEPFLYFLLDSETANAISNSVGGSIEGRATEIIDEKVTKMVGGGYSITSKGNVPLCSKEAGCGIPLAAAEVRKAPIGTSWNFKKADYTQEQLERACAFVDTTKPKEERTKEDCKLAYKLPDGVIVWAGVHAAMSALNGARTPVNIPKSDKETVYKVLTVAYSLFDKQPPELKAGIESKGGDRNMADKIEEKEEVSFSAAQMQERITAAVTEASAISDNAHKAELADINTAHVEESTKATEAHTTELSKQETEIYERAAVIEELRHKLGLSEEKLKELKEAKTSDEVLKFITSLEIKKEAEVAASVKEGGEGATGIVVASAVSQTSTVTKIEEVGSYDPYKKEWIATFREEVE